MCVYVYVPICVYTCIYVCVHIYIYIYLALPPPAGRPPVEDPGAGMPPPRAGGPRDQRQMANI